MKLPRWNNAQRPHGKSVEPSASHSGQGLEVKKRFSLPVEGEVFFLTFPFIDQAFKLKISGNGTSGAARLVAGKPSENALFVTEK
jgi:hypothetical protein